MRAPYPAGIDPPIEEVSVHNIDAKLAITVAARLRAAGCVLAENEALLLLQAASTRTALDALVDRRMAGHPLEHILGWAEFHGLRILVGPGVFVPRRRTEFLVDHTISLARARLAHSPAVRALDLCCGSGAVGAALAASVAAVEVYAADIDPVAATCARRNLVRFRSRVFEGDLYAPLPTTLRGTVDILIANAPYVPTDALHLLPPEARLHEPRVALDGGVDGLDLHRRIAAEARDWLAPGGMLVIETGREQAVRAVALFTSNGLAASVRHDDDRDATIVTGRVVT